MGTTDYKVYCGIDNKRKIYITVSPKLAKKDAVRLANKYFKVCNTDLECVTGYTIGNDLYLGLQPINDRRSSTGVWVITKKAR